MVRGEGEREEGARGGEGAKVTHKQRFPGPTYYFKSAPFLRKKVIVTAREREM